MLDADSILAAARQAWLADQFDRALDLFRQARQSAPQDLRLAVEFANYLGMRFEVSEAVRILKQCEPALMGNANALYQLGMAYHRSYRSDDALRCFQMAAELSAHESALIEITKWYERRGKLALAEQAIDKCSAASPEVQLWRGRLSLRRGDTKIAKACFETLVDNGRVVGETATAAYYELAGLHDRADDAEAAVEAAKSAKRIQAPLLKPHLATAKALSPIQQNFVATASHAYFDKWARSASHRPIALLAGAPRSGSSLMTRMLGMHPQLTVSDEIEVYSTHLQPRMLAGQSGTNAAEILDSLTEQHLSTCRGTYERWMGEALGRDLTDSVLLDKFPSTTFLIPAFRRLFPNATILMPLRDPRDVVISCFLRYLPLNPVSSMFARLDWTVARCCAEWKAWLLLREKLTMPWVEIRYEDVIARDYAGLDAALTSVGLEWSDRFANFQSSLEFEPVRSPTYAQLREQVTQQRTGRWKLYESFLQPHLATLNQMAAELGYESS